MELWSRLTNTLRLGHIPAGAQGLSLMYPHGNSPFHWLMWITKNKSILPSCFKLRLLSGDWKKNQKIKKSKSKVDVIGCASKRLGVACLLRAALQEERKKWRIRFDLPAGISLYRSAEMERSGGWIILVRYQKYQQCWERERSPTGHSTGSARPLAGKGFVTKLPIKTWTLGSDLSIPWAIWSICPPILEIEYPKSIP